MRPFFSRSIWLYSLLFPSIAVLTFMVSGAIFTQLLFEQSRVFDSFSRQQLAASVQLTQVFADFTSNHDKIYQLLQDSEVGLDESGIYSNSRHLLDKTEKSRTQLLELPLQYPYLKYIEGFEQRYQQLLVQTRSYNQEAISALMQASVDVRLAASVMEKNHSHYGAINQSYYGLIQLLNVDGQRELRTFQQHSIERGQVLIAWQLLASVLLLIFGIAFARRICHPLGGILHSIHQITSGNMGSRCQLKSFKEIESLADEVNQLAESLEYAKATGEAKSAFLANMSHEIRTPMNGILGAAELLLGADLEEREKTLIELIYHSCKSMLRLVNDILDFSQIDSGEMNIVISPFDLIAEINDLEKLFRNQCPASITFDVYIGTKEQSLLLLGDVERIRQILVNLLSNAFKFTIQGSVKLTAIIGDPANGQCHVVFAVEDTGTGIREKDLNNIFRDFYQADHSSTRIHGGAGLGLAISQQLAQLMGGDLTAESTYGQGSTFALELLLPLAEAELRTVSETRQVINSFHKHVLVAEDNVTNQKIVVAMLSKMGITTEVAENGCEVLHLLAKSDFDLILMDVHMPLMDGIETARKVRRFRSKGAEIPIVALTASTFSVDVKRCLDAGMNGFIGKPVTMKKLSFELDKVWNTAY